MNSVAVNPKNICKEIIYLDYHSTTPCDPRVVEAMSPFFSQFFGNPSSPHKWGRQSQEAIERAREQVADSVGALPGELVFTSGATESNNIALIGIGTCLSPKGRVLVSQIEHKSVLNTARILSERGYDVLTIPCDSGGVVDVDWLKDHLTTDTILVSVQAVNNELGTVQPIGKIAELVNNAGAHFHSDAAQSLDRMEVNVKRWGVDSCSFSAHKAYGPKGVGALYIKGGRSRWSDAKLQFGGGQESGIRPGTENVPAIVGFGKACELIKGSSQGMVQSYKEWRDLFEKGIAESLPNIEILGDPDSRLPTTSNIRFEGTNAEAVLARLDKVMLSSGSACESGAPEPSHVLEAIGLDRQAAYECIRMAVGRFTTRDEIEFAVECVVDAVRQVRAVMELEAY